MLLTRLAEADLRTCNNTAAVPKLAWMYSFLGRTTDRERSIFPLLKTLTQNCSHNYRLKHQLVLILLNTGWIWEYHPEHSLLKCAQILIYRQTREVESNLHYIAAYSFLNAAWLKSCDFTTQITVPDVTYHPQRNSGQAYCSCYPTQQQILFQGVHFSFPFSPLLTFPYELIKLWSPTVGEPVLSLSPSSALACICPQDESTMVR